MGGGPRLHTLCPSILPPEIVASESSSKAGLARLYSRYSRVVPGRFGGVSNIDPEARDAID
eukprot:scaffold34916_cov57-Phaeocystis_antarctica.AAC.2